MSETAKIKELSKRIEELENNIEQLQSKLEVARRCSECYICKLSCKNNNIPYE